MHIVKYEEKCVQYILYQYRPSVIEKGNLSLISRNVIALAHSVSLSVSELLEFRQLDFCHHNLVCLIIMKYSNTWVG
jgi:hypothetical protein